MQVRVEDLNTVKKKLHIEIPEDVVQKELDEAYRNLKKTASVKGFRKGKVPRSVLESLYAKEVHTDILGRLIQDSYSEAVRTNEINVLGMPSIDPPALNTKGPYRYEADVEVPPVLEDIDWKGLRLQQNIYPVQDDEIENQLRVMQKQASGHKPIKESRPVQKGDYAVIDYETLENGKLCEEFGKAENTVIRVGDNWIDEELDKKLTGMSVGDSGQATIRFPDSHPKLAGREVIFNLKLNEIREDDLLDIDDEFAKLFGQFKTLEELKEAILKNMTDSYERRSERELHESVFSSLLEKMDFEVPEILVLYELENIVSETRRSFESNNTSMEELGITVEDLRERYQGMAVKLAKRHLVMEKLISQEKIVLSDDEWDAELKKMAAVIGKPFEEIKSDHDKNPDQFAGLKQGLLEKKVMSLIIENSEVEKISA